MGKYVRKKPVAREGYKICSKCNQELPATTKYFYKNKGGKYGLNSQCKSCQKKYDSMFQKAYYEKNKYARMQYMRNRRKNNPEIVRTQRENCINKNKDKYREKIRYYSQKREALKRRLLADFNAEEWELCKKVFNNKCCYCNKKAELTQDHFIPLSKGGEYTKSNIVPACASCNSSKNKKDFFEWYPQQEFYDKKREQKILNYLNYQDGFQQIAMGQ
jgi:5-methylcytosine-specific restriction endonuclease McrA